MFLISQDGESTLKSDSKSPARRSEIPILMKSKLKRQAVIASGQSSPCKQQAISSLSAGGNGPSATSSPSRLPAAASTNGQHIPAAVQSKLKPRNEFASPKPLLRSTKSSNNSSSELYGRWESCSPALNDYSSPSRLIRATRDQMNSEFQGWLNQNYCLKKIHRVIQGGIINGLF